MARFAAEPGREKDLRQLPRQFRTQDPPAQAEDVQVVVLHALAGRIGVVADGGPDAGELAGGDADAHGAPADQDPALGPAVEHGLRDGSRGVGVVDGPGSVGAEIEDPEAAGAEPGDEVALEHPSGVVARDGDLQ